MKSRNHTTVIACLIALVVLCVSLFEASAAHSQASNPTVTGKITALTIKSGLATVKVKPSGGTAIKAITTDYGLSLILSAADGRGSDVVVTYVAGDPNVIQGVRTQ